MIAGRAVSGLAVPPFTHLALIGNALPRQCGMATYTSHVADALRQRYPAMRLDHYAMDDGSGISYPESILTIDADSPTAYREAAAQIDASGAEAIWLQHEYGIFGGVAGSDILELVEARACRLSSRCTRCSSSHRTSGRRPTPADRPGGRTIVMAAAAEGY